MKCPTCGVEIAGLPACFACHTVVRKTPPVKKKGKKVRA